MGIIKRPSKFYSLTVSILGVLFFGTVALLGLPIDLLTLRHRRKQAKLGLIATWVKLNWARWMLWSHGIQLEIQGPFAEKMRYLRGAVYVANHQSAIDIPVNMQLLPQNVCFLAKKELRKVPIFGWAAKVVGTIFIDREKGARDETLNDLNSFVKNGYSILFYPEGTRSEAGHLLPFKRGAFVTAIQAQAPIVPIVNLNTHTLCPKKSAMVKPGVARVYVDNPIPTTRLTVEDRHTLADRVRSIMSKHLENFAENRKNTVSGNS